MLEPPSLGSDSSESTQPTHPLEHSTEFDARMPWACPFCDGQLRILIVGWGEEKSGL